LFVLAGILVVFHPVFALRTLSTLVGIGLLISSADHLVPYFTLRSFNLRPAWLLVSGIVDAVYGLVFILPSGPVFFAVLAGLWVLFFACARAYMAYLNWRLRAPRWWITAAGSFVMTFAALFLLAHPSGWMALTGAVFIAVGAFAITEGRILYGA
jgi:uncharacterized membrane protein HdeD (DUF308 family)